MPGTGGEAWQALLQAARTFAAESHTGKEYPHLGPESACPLCQQPLGSASVRLVAFDEFIQQEAEKNARALRQEAETLYGALSNADHSIGLSAEDKTELAGLDPVLANECEAFQTGINARHAAIKAACNPAGSWDSIGQSPAEVASKLQALAARLSAEAETLEKTVDLQARAALQRELNELDARKQLRAIKAAVLDAIAKIDLKGKLKACEASVRTKVISDKSASLSQSIVTKELADALNAELKALHVSELQVALKPVTEKAKTAYKLILELPGSAPAKDILSEGEQRAIAIASFLAEVNKGGSRGGVVFDDPVSSLDHRRRGYVAKRLVQEAVKRQVIVFTHDLYFICLLEKEARQMKTTLHTMSLRKTSAGFGVAADGVPFDGAKVKDRLKTLRSLQLECASLDKAGDGAAEESVRVVYGRLRVAWEGAVEEVLLNGVIWRFDAGVSTNSLREVAVEDADWQAINNAMSKCSAYAAHDGAAIANVPVPTPAELALDIEALETWRKATEARKEQLRKARPR